MDTLTDVQMDNLLKEEWDINNLLLYFARNGDEESRRLYEAARNYFSHRVKDQYPDIDEPGLAQNLFDDERVQQALEDSVTKTLIRNLRVSIMSLQENKEFRERLTEYLSRKNPDWNLEEDTAEELLNGEFADRMQKAIDGNKQQERELNLSGNGHYN